MSLRINTNVSPECAAQSLRQADSVSASIAKIRLRINNAADDPAGLSWRASRSTSCPGVSNARRTQTTSLKDTAGPPGRTRARSSSLYVRQNRRERRQCVQAQSAADQVARGIRITARAKLCSTERPVYRRSWTQRGLKLHRRHIRRRHTLRTARNLHNRRLQQPGPRRSAHCKREVRPLSMNGWNDRPVVVVVKTDSPSYRIEDMEQVTKVNNLASTTGQRRRTDPAGAAELRRQLQDRRAGGARAYPAGTNVSGERDRLRSLSTGRRFGSVGNSDLCPVAARRTTPEGPRAPSRKQHALLTRSQQLRDQLPMT